MVLVEFAARLLAEVALPIVLAVVSVRLANRYYELPSIRWSSREDSELTGGEIQ